VATHERNGEGEPASVTANTLEFLTWLAARPRTYADVMEAWQTSCPRLSVWEDSLIDRLVERQGRSPDSAVTLTDRGHLIINGG
jgi:hypothetical protein